MSLVQLEFLGLITNRNPRRALEFAIWIAPKSWRLETTVMVEEGSGAGIYGLGDKILRCTSATLCIHGCIEGGSKPDICMVLELRPFV